MKTFFGLELESVAFVAICTNFIENLSLHIICMLVMVRPNQPSYDRMLAGLLNQEEFESHHESSLVLPF